MQPKVLVVEDLGEIQNILRRILERSGFQVFCAGDGPDGIALAERERPDLILLDLTLPTLSGQQTAERIRALEALRHVPILAMSGKIDEHASSACFNGYIAKPFDLAQLVATVKQHLGMGNGGN
ncbi:MAG: hypothetical protein KatS3mg057_2967 [Herpetosiphonaceae bacterium]|nr:MAG: hypothetical protein KatS3mg057_2967 [Herpetosiphonaceae bacterium]